MSGLIDVSSQGLLFEIARRCVLGTIGISLGAITCILNAMLINSLKGTTAVMISMTSSFGMAVGGIYGFLTGGYSVLIVGIVGHLFAFLLMILKMT